MHHYIFRGFAFHDHSPDLDSKYLPSHLTRGKSLLILWDGRLNSVFLPIVYNTPVIHGILLLTLNDRYYNASLVFSCFAKSTIKDGYKVVSASDFFFFFFCAGKTWLKFEEIRLIGSDKKTWQLEREIRMTELNNDTHLKNIILF